MRPSSFAPSLKRMPPLASVAFLGLWILGIFYFQRTPSSETPIEFVIISASIALVTIAAALSFARKISLRTTQVHLHVLAAVMFASAAICGIAALPLEHHSPARTMALAGSRIFLSASLIIAFIFDGSLKSHYSLRYLSGMQAVTFRAFAKAIIDKGKLDILKADDLVRIEQKIRGETRLDWIGVSSSSPLPASPLMDETASTNHLYQRSPRIRKRYVAQCCTQHVSAFVPELLW